MKRFLIAVLLMVGTVYGEDQVTIRYRPGNSRSARSIVITIGRPFDKSDELIPGVYRRLEAIHKLERTSFAVPDSGHISIAAELDGKRLESTSCHTLFEANENLVARSTGVSALNGMTRKEALAGEPKDFLEFRRLWEEALAMSMKAVSETLAP